MLKLGTSAPQIVTQLTDGTSFSLHSLLGKKVVLFFFPKAFTSGCTLQTRLLREQYQALASQGVEIVGVSTDPLETQCDFVKKEGVSFPMIADTSKEVSCAFGVLRSLLGVAKRVTYILDEQGIIRAVFHREFRVKTHVEEVLDFLQNMSKKKTG